MVSFTMPFLLIVAKIKRECTADIERMRHLEQKRGKQVELQKTEVRLGKLVSIVQQNLDNCAAKEKRLALDALNIKAVVTRDRVQIQGVIPMDLVTSKQTSGYMLANNLIDNHLYKKRYLLFFYP